ncbi:MAG: DUF4012 domain-containing protein, partial [Chloroflexi bacterium]|nr:DUF4012 domain-containing protein [Chloroflexota bacterium]
PVVGPDLAAGPHLLDMAVSGLAAADAGLAGGAPALNAALGGGGLSAAVAGLSEGAPHLIRAEAALLEVEAARRLIPRVNDSRLQRLLAQADTYLPRVQAGVRAALAAPAMLGLDGPRTYLVLGQNNDELRPTGGFIGTAGIV